MEEGEAWCQNQTCRRPLKRLRGHRRREYCDGTCRQAAHRAREAAARLVEQEEARQAQIAGERACLQERWGELLPESLDLLQSLQPTSLVERVASVIVAERDRMLSEEERRHANCNSRLEQRFAYAETQACCVPEDP